LAVRVSTWANVAFLAVGPTAIAYLCYYRALRTVTQPNPRESRPAS
jgi:drug/metabolite transporter (DMT)-like permease